VVDLIQLKIVLGFQKSHYFLTSQFNPSSLLAFQPFQNLQTFLELLGKIYLDLMKVFFTNLQLKNDVFLSSVKGVHMEISKKAWKDVARLRAKGVQVRNGETGVVQEFNKVQYYGQCLRNPGVEINHFHVDGLKVDERLLTIIITKIIVPRGSNHSTLNKGVLISCIASNTMCKWIGSLCFVNTSSRQRGSRILGCPMWLWYPSS